MGLSKMGEGLLNIDFDNLTNLNNGNYHQILFTNGCSPAMFHYDCIAKHYVNNPNGGGVAFIGNSDVGYYSEHAQFENFCKALYQDGLYYLGIAFQRVPAAGSALNGARRRLHLLGDPEMPVWTATPTTLTVATTLSGSIGANGERTINVTVNGIVPGKPALICIKKGDEYYTTKTIATNGTHTFTFIPHNTGIADVTVSGQNYKPVERTVNVIVNKSIFINNLTFYENGTGNSIGNGDGQLDAGETVELTIQLKNSGISTATINSANLLCNFPNIITIENATSSFANISAGSTQNSQQKYRFTINPDAPEILINDINQIKFILEINATINGVSSAYYEMFNIDIYKPELEIGNQSIVSGNINSNSTVTINIDLFNRGKAVATGVKAVLAPNNCPYIINCSSTQKSYPAIGKYETETNTSAYQFTISSSYSGQPLNFILQVTNQYGKTWNLEFDLCDRPDPLAIQLTDTYFTSDRNSIKVFWTPDSQAVGYNIYRCDADANGDEVGNYEKLNTFIFPAAFYNDEGLPELTKYYYKISAVSESGNESTPTQALPAWTSYSLMDGYPISMNITGTIRGSINVEDVFGDGNKEIFTSISQSDGNNGYLIGLKSDGTEWFNLDGNVTNKSGFAELGIDTWCTPAIGELEPGGGYKVLSMTRKVNFNSNKIFCHSALEDPLEPNPLNIANWEHIFSGDQCLRGPMIADVNNNGISECIFYGDYGRVKIYSSSGEPLYSFVRNDHRVTYSALAVADLNGNGNKEIIGCYYQGDTPGLYIWNYDGTNFGNQQPFYSLSGYKFKGSVVVCDLNNNGKKDILTIAINESTNKARVIAIEINSNGTYTNIWNSTKTINISDPLAVEISVGDLNNDGNLEVVVMGDDGIYIWSNTGRLFNFIPLNFPGMRGRLALLADVDNDHEAEIIITYGKTIDAYKMDGTRVLGFPLQVEEDIEGYPCIADIDNDGQNEIIVGSGSKVYAWKTVGNPDIIEWGCQRANPRNTGEYTPVPCQDIIISENTNETWTTDHYICGNITIEPNATLTILNNTLHMRKNATITICPSGKLIVNGGIITNSNDYEMWSGIIVEGTANTAQTYNTHACVDLKNGALIENATCAIKSFNGGIVQANEAIFKNNVYGIYLEPYSFSHTLSSMKNSEFVTDVLFEKTNVKFPKAHIYLKGVKELYIYGNDFKNTMPYDPPLTIEQINPYYIECRGTGIHTTESHFSTSPVTLGTSLTGTGNNFTGLYCGIQASGQKDSPVDIRYNVFDNNFRGVYVANGNGSRVIFNEINTSTEEGQLEMISFPFPDNGTPNSMVRYGAYLNSCTNFKFEENTIKYGTAGMYIYNTGEASGQKIYRNDFGITSFTSTLGTVVVGKNSDYITGNSNTGNIGLQINCNKYIKTDNAITVLNGNMRKTQGSSTSPVLNKFRKAPYSNGMEFKVQINTSTLPMWDFSKYDLGTYTYYQYPNSTNPDVLYNYQLTPGKYTAGKVSPYQTNVLITSLTCLSTYALNPGTGVIIPLMGAIGDFGDNLSDLEIEYSRIVDKGNEELMTSTAENMNNQNYVTSYQQLSNSGYLSDNVYSAIIENTKAPVAAKAAVLINNSPMPETSKQELESSTMDSGLKSLVMEYQEGVNSREQLEYQISDIKQEIASLEIDMISSMFYNEESQEDKSTLINYFASKTDGNYNDKLNAYKLQLSSNDYVSARASLQELRTLATEIDEELAEEIERYCDINTIFLNSLKNNLIDTAVLALHKDELLEAALSESWLYSAQAKTLYSYLTDTVFLEYTPLPEDVFETRKQTEKVDIPDLFNPKLKVYPNPSLGLVFIEYDFRQNYEPGYDILFETIGKVRSESCNKGMVNIYSFEGKLLQTQELKNEKGLKTIDISSLPPGTYILEISDCYENKTSEKITKQ